jgi:TonB family protein
MLVVLAASYTAYAQSQIPNQYQQTPSCVGRIFQSGEIPIGQKAKIIFKPAPNMTQEALQHDVHGRVVLEGVLCRTGRVTDLRVIEGLTYGMTDEAIKAARSVKFIPAEVKWHSVSQTIRFEYLFNDRGAGGIAANDAAGGLVERIEVVGYRRISRADIIKHIQTKLGEPYSQEQIQRDLASILSTGNFDALRTRVTMEAGVRGGVVIVFEVQELPLISEVKFHGLGRVSESLIVQILLDNHIDVRNGAVYDPTKVRVAIDVITRFLKSNERNDVKVEERTERVSATNVALSFVISRE